MTRMIRGRSATGALSVGALALVGLALAPTAVAATATPVHGYDIVDYSGTGTLPAGWSMQLSGQAGAWMDYDSRTNTNGSIHMGVSATTENVWLRKAPATATTLSGVTTGSYESVVDQGSTPATYQLALDCNNSTAGGAVTLTWSAPSQATGAAWRTNTVTSGSWKADHTINGDGSTSASSSAPTGTGIQGGTAHTLDEFKAVCGTGTVTSYGITLPGASTVRESAVDTITFNTEVSDFQYVGIDRIAGSDRVATSIAASKDLFTAVGTANQANAVVVASSTSFADGLSGGPLATYAGGPLLLSGKDHIDSRVLSEIKRTLSTGSTVYLVGGTGALSSTLESEVRSAGFDVQRLSGSNRFATAVAVANAMADVTSVFVTDGMTFPDALSAGPAAAHKVGAVLLTNGTSMPVDTANYLKAHTSLTRYAVGGSASTASTAYVPSSNRFVGANRFETSTKVATAIFPGTDKVAFASGMAFPDALSGGAYAGLLDEPLLLVPTTGSVPAATQTYLNTNKKALTAAEVVGGTAAVDNNMVGALEGIINYGS